MRYDYTGVAFDCSLCITTVYLQEGSITSVPSPSDLLEISECEHMDK